MSEYIDADDKVEVALGISREDVPANSNASKNGGHPVPRHGRANVQKRSVAVPVKEKTFWQRVKEAFIGDDIKKLPERVLFNRVIPSIKRSIHEVLDDTIDGVLGPKSKASDAVRRATRRDSGDYIVEYDRVYDDPRPRQRTSQSRTEFIRQYVFPSRDDAEAELRVMRTQIEDNGFCSVLFVRDRFGEPVMPVDDKWGWYSLVTASPIPVENGMYILDLPDARYRERTY